MTTPEAIADEVLPLDSTDPRQVLAAANLLVDLVRRLCRATRHAEAVPTPQAADAIVSALAIATGGMPQLCTQLAARLHAIGALPGLAADDLDTITDPTVTVASARMSIGLAGSKADEAGHCLRTAARHTSRLLLDDSQAPVEEPPLPPQPKLQGP